MFSDNLYLLFAPFIIYNNADKDKDLIMKENKRKCGVYRWVHISSGKSYIGSSINLYIRFSQYYNYNHISNNKANMSIYKALLKYGYAEFRLEILEICSTDILIEREQFYMDEFKPEYNVLKIAGSSKGHRHSEATKELMSRLAKGRKFTPETILKMKDRIVSEEVKRKISAKSTGRHVSSETRGLISKAIKGIKRSESTLLKMALVNQHRKPVILTNIETGVSKEFISMTEAGNYLGTSRVQIRNYLNNNKPYKGYIISIGKL
jgi:group I intron endonuclease